MTIETVLAPAVAVRFYLGDNEENVRYVERHVLAGLREHRSLVILIEYEITIGLISNDLKRMKRFKGHPQEGFRTSKQEFVDRKEAAKIAIAAGQVPEEKIDKTMGLNSHTFFSYIFSS